MSRLEKLLFPIIVVVAITGILLVGAGESTAVIVARTVGVILVTLLLVGFVVRSVVKYRRGKRENREVLEAYQAARQELLDEIAAEEAAADGKA